MKKKTFLCLILTATVFLSAFTTFRNETGQDGANVVSSQTPEDTASCGAIWARKFSSKSISYNSIPILAKNAIYVVNSDILYEISYSDGQILRQTKLSQKMDSVCNMLLDEHFLYIPLTNGTMECINTQSMQSVWQSKSFGGQSLSTIFYHKGYLYAGATNIVSSTQTTGIFYCLNASDGSVVWTYEDNENLGGYYWSGAIAYDNALYFTGDNGILVCHSLTDNTVYDTHILTATAKIRAGLTYNQSTNALYTVANDGTLFQIKCKNNKIDLISSNKIINTTGFINCTSTPTIYNNRLYVGCIANQYGYVCVIDAQTLKSIYQVKGAQGAEIKSSPLVSANSLVNDEVTVYVSANLPPGGLYCFSDSTGKTSASMHTLFTPEAKQYCLSSIVADTKGNLYYSNDSGTLFCVSKNVPQPTATASKKKTDAATKSNTSKVNTTTTKVKKPYRIKVKKTKKKYQISWKKKKKNYQTTISYRYSKGKWKKKTLKSNSSITLKRSKKKLQFRLRCRQHLNKKWVYSPYTKLFSFRP